MLKSSWVTLCHKMQLISFTGLDINYEVLFSAVLIDLVCVCPALGNAQRISFVYVVCCCSLSIVSVLD